MLAYVWHHQQGTHLLAFVRHYLQLTLTVQENVWRRRLKTHIGPALSIALILCYNEIQVDDDYSVIS